MDISQNDRESKVKKTPKKSRRDYRSSTSKSSRRDVKSSKRKNKRMSEKRKRKTHSTKHKRRKVRESSSSSDSSSSEDSSTSSSETSSSSSSMDEKRQKKKMKRKSKNETQQTDCAETSADIPIELMSSCKSMAPVTKEEWEKKQSVIKRVYDESAGRHRLIKGDGEVIEEIVSRDRHKQINQEATKGDGDYFQKHLKRL